MGCSRCGQRAAARRANGSAAPAQPSASEVKGWRVVYPSGPGGEVRQTPDDALFLTPGEARAEVMRFGGGAIKRVLR
jgi:hypothetical protein